MIPKAAIRLIITLEDGAAIIVIEEVSLGLGM